ncbi:hypothetical protein M408DRAFT_27312 [Serendipita vermifera MAFF 305830]|uniref:Beta-lactamase-related domain-containing protein n=1 Tax=Serendipita vermifera MAFF 305830 TaxID=933852 RepID=A0A0C2WCL6_SERVB|nr:hypothetical protein M408DRAFT_27312 [Serendipita vermifera MAFF 305830]
MKRILAGAGLLTPWLLGIGSALGSSIPNLHQRDQTITTGAESACRPPLPSILLQKYPPSAEDAALQSLLANVQSAAAASVATDGVDSVSLGIVGPQGLIWYKGFGKAQANGTDDAPPNEHTIYRIASISKMFAAMEGFVLQDKGYLSWEDSVVKHVPNFTYNPQSWIEYLENTTQPSSGDEDDPIILRQLASHTSGIGRDLPYYNLEGYPNVTADQPPRQQPTSNEQLQAIASIPLVAAPGSFPMYSNTGFSVLGEALVAANAKTEGNRVSYADLLKRDIFGPLAMNGSSFVASPENAAHLAIPQVSAEVDYNPDESFQPPGGQFSSVADLANTVQFLLNPTSATGSRIIRTPSLREWIRPSFAEYDNATETGLVWEILKLTDQYGQVQRFYGKAGDLQTFHSQLSFSRELQFGAVVLNTGNAVAPFVSRDALQLLLPGIQSILEERAKERYAGSWKNDANPDDEIVIVVEKGILAITKWIFGGNDFLELYLAGTIDRALLWSTGRLDEFRIAVGTPGLNTDPLMGCFSYWTALDALASRHVSLDLLYFIGEGDQRLMKVPSLNAVLHR